ncbi:probable ATP-dependent RNA helicase DDX43 [Cloeon dipterum]|uniref:probable ATP-dependent RNA helicase DDX43 n=1 Tax=Cloeon dipterum TaxID=197152 RepID=UPI0032202E22
MNSFRRGRGKAAYGSRQQQQQQYSSHFENGGSGSGYNLTSDNFPELSNSAVMNPPPLLMMNKPQMNEGAPPGSYNADANDGQAYGAQPHAYQVQNPVYMDSQQMHQHKNAQNSNGFPYGAQMADSGTMQQPAPDEYTRMAMANNQMMYPQPQVQYCNMNQAQMYQPSVMYEGSNTPYGSPRHYFMVPAGQAAPGSFVPPPPMYGQPPLWMCQPPPQQNMMYQPRNSTPPEMAGVQSGDPQSWMTASTESKSSKSQDKNTQTSPMREDRRSAKEQRLLMKVKDLGTAVDKSLTIKEEGDGNEWDGWDTTVIPGGEPQVKKDPPPKNEDGEQKNAGADATSDKPSDQSSMSDMTDSFSFNFQQANEEAKAFREAQLALLTPIVKDVYREHTDVTNLSDEDVEKIRSSKNISAHFPKPEELTPLFKSEQEEKDYSQMSIPKPVTSFNQAYEDYPEILSEVQKQGFTEPTPIQSQLWPCIMKGMDVVGIAQTGSGKTLGFLLPAFIHIEKQKKPRAERKSPTVLILAPTRELAQQIHKEVSKYSYKNIWSACVYGGAPKNEQVDILKRNPDIIIATPGRLNDLVLSNDIDLQEVSFLVLDEADEMLNQGFEPQINKTLNRVREDRQTVLTSATWPQSVRRMAKNYTTDPVMVVIGTVELRAVNSVKQNVEFIEENDKYDWLVNFLSTKMTESDKLIVFVGRRSFADHLSSELSLLNWSCVCIHGALPQSDRDTAISKMQTGETKVLIASDVVARGIDIECVTYIINYDVPKSSEQYIHRIGRTGRAGRTGESFTLVTRRDWFKAQDLVDVIKNAGQEVPEELLAMAERYKNRIVRNDGRGGRSHHRSADGSLSMAGNQAFGQRSASFSNAGGYGMQRDFGRFGDFNERRSMSFSGGNGQSYGNYNRGQADYSNRGQMEFRGSADFSHRGQGDSYGRPDRQYGRGRSRSFQ